MSIQYLDKAGAVTLANKIKELLNGKVNTGDVENGAQVNVIESVSVNGTALAITSKGVNVIVPTKLMDLTADSTHAFVTDAEKASYAAKQNALVFNTAYNASSNKVATMTDVANAVGQITGIEFSVVSSLPASGKTGTIYLVAHSHGTSDAYDEYIWVSSKWEKIGSTDVDLSGYVKTTDLTAIPDSEINALFTS